MRTDIRFVAFVMAIVLCSCSNKEYLSHECRLVNSKKEFRELLTAEVSLPDLPLEVKLKKI